MQKNQKSGRFLVFDNVNRCIHRQNVRVWPESEDLTTADWCDQGLVTKGFPRVDVGKVDFDGGQPHRSDGIAQGDTGVGVGCRVENDDAEFPLRLLDPGNQFPFEIGLPEFDSHAKLFGPLTDLGLNVSQGRSSIDPGLTLAQQVQVGTIQV